MLGFHKEENLGTKKGLTAPPGLDPGVALTGVLQCSPRIQAREINSYQVNSCGRRLDGNVVLYGSGCYLNSTAWFRVFSLQR